MWQSGGPTTKCECIVNGNRMVFDAQTGGSLKKAKEFYKNMDYIGSGKVVYYNGVKSKVTKIAHFFIRKNNHNL